LDPLDVEYDLTETVARPRFPALRVAACAVGLLAAAYLWLGWGWRWDVTPGDVVSGKPSIPFPGGWVGRYVRVLGCGIWRTERLERGSIIVRRDGVRVLPTDRVVVLPRNWAANLPCAFFELSADDAESRVLACLDADRWPDPAAPSGRLWSTKVRDFTGNRQDRKTPRSRTTGALVVDTRRGRLDGMTAIAIVLAFWSVVLGQMWIREWRSDSSHYG